MRNEILEKWFFFHVPKMGSNWDLKQWQYKQNLSEKWRLLQKQPREKLWQTNVCVGQSRNSRIPKKRNIVSNLTDQIR